MVLISAIASTTANNLDNLSEGATVANGQCCFTEGPVKSLLSHSQGNDDVNIFRFLYIPEIRHYLFSLFKISIVDKICDFQLTAILRLDMVNTRIVNTLILSDALENLVHFHQLLLCRFGRIHIGDVDDCLFIEIKHIAVLQGIEIDTIVKMESYTQGL